MCEVAIKGDRNADSTPGDVASGTTVQVVYERRYHVLKNPSYREVGYITPYG
jgi:hypothetical protein